MVGAQHFVPLRCSHGFFIETNRKMIYFYGDD
jgi:hypothetical protein